MGSGGGGTTTSTATAASPEVGELQRQAIPQIGEMLRQNPLGQYAAWTPRQIAGTNPFYESMFNLTPSLFSQTPSSQLLFGPQPSVFPNQAIPNVGVGPFGPGSGSVVPPPGVSAGSIQDIVNSMAQKEFTSKLQSRVDDINKSLVQTVQDQLQLAIPRFIGGGGE